MGTGEQLSPWRRRLSDHICDSVDLGSVTDGAQFIDKPASSYHVIGGKRRPMHPGLECSDLA
jgi:hypothetical protein